MAKTSQCNRTPRGWVCYQTRDHDGPCPAYRAGARATLARRLIPLLEKWSYGW